MSHDEQVKEATAAQGQLGMCDKRQYEHNGPHLKIGKYGQNLPPFPCINWHPVIVPKPKEMKGSL
jgi:hypothetical protein